MFDVPVGGAFGDQSTKASHAYTHWCLFSAFLLMRRTVLGHLSSLGRPVITARTVIGGQIAGPTTDQICSRLPDQWLVASPMSDCQICSLLPDLWLAARSVAESRTASCSLLSGPLPWLLAHLSAQYTSKALSTAVGTSVASGIQGETSGTFTEHTFTLKARIRMRQKDPRDVSANRWVGLCRPTHHVPMQAYPPCTYEGLPTMYIQL